MKLTSNDSAGPVLPLFDLKWCTAGKHWATRAIFTPDKRKKDGRSSWCKDCANAKARSRYHNDIEAARAYNKQKKANNPTRYLHIARRWRQRHPESKRLDYLKHKEQYIQRSKRRYAADPESIKAAATAWRKANPERHQLQRLNQKARLISAAGQCSYVAWIDKCKYHGWRCYLCGRPVSKKIGAKMDGSSLTVDHRTSMRRGGSHWPANVAPSCNRCNARKRSLSEGEYADYIQMCRLPKLRPRLPL